MRAFSLDGLVGACSYCQNQDFQDFAGARFLRASAGLANEILIIQMVLRIMILRKARWTAPGGAGALILAFSHQGRRDTLAGIWDWLLVAISVGKLWIPAFAGMTGGGALKWRKSLNPRLNPSNISLQAHQGRGDLLVALGAFAGNVGNS